MIDHLLAFPDEVAAHADSVVGAYWTPGTKGSPPAWNGNCIPNILVWDPATDTSEAIDGPHGGVLQRITHHLIDTKFRVTITTPEPVPELINHPNLELAVDHTAGTVLRTTFTAPQLATLHLQPVFSGSAYPFMSGSGGLSR